MKHIHTICEQNAKLLDVNEVHIAATRLYRVKLNCKVTG
jgi:hypothetical protein